MPLSEDREARLMWRVRWFAARKQLQQLLGEARLRTLLVAGLSVFFWCGLFALFYEGFSFLVRYVGAPGAVYHATTIRFVFDLFFASLNVMLVFSSGIIVYGGLFASRETRFLLSQPVRPERVVLHKFQEAVLFSSWGFFLLASPLAIAYGAVAEAPWHYFVVLLPLILSFVYIPCAIGAIACLLVVYFLPRLKRATLAATALLTIGFTGRSIWLSLNGPQAELFGVEWFKETLHRFSFTQQLWLPSTWLSNGLLEAARPTPVGPVGLGETPLLQSVLYLSVLISNALLLHLVVIEAAKRLFRPGFSRLECRETRRRRAGVAFVDRVAGAVLSPAPTKVRLLLMKDWQLLRRDPVQWSQFLIFFGLLGLYFLNIDRFRNPSDDVSYITWVNMVSFLNLAVVGLILSTFTTRFIYPMISLEGKRFWVLGRLPVDRRTIVLSKFLFAAVGSLAPCGGLVLLSDLMLRVDPIVVVVHQLTTLLLCVGLAAMAVGFGATMPDFRESSPSKIAAGFGGTLNLVLSALYIILIVSLTALPCHFVLIAETSPMSNTLLDLRYLRFWLIFGTFSAVGIGLTSTFLTLRHGLRSFERLEVF
ncbi:MAG: hypothetical protein AAGG46_02025 [Planctomycetota bacterium]